MGHFTGGQPVMVTALSPLGITAALMCTWAAVACGLALAVRHAHVASAELELFVCGRTRLVVHYRAIGACGFQTNHNVSLYTSSDLVHWQYEGVVFGAQGNLPANSVLFAPKTVRTASVLRQRVPA